MKKIILYLSIIFIIFISISCMKDKTVNIYIESDTIPEYSLNNFNLEDYYLTVIKSNGEVEKVQLEPSMISMEDYSKLNEYGTHIITVFYDDLNVSFNINVVHKTSTYLVEYLLEELDGSYKSLKYERYEGETYSTPEITDEYSGFTLDRVEGGRIEPNNSSIFKAYYKRNIYSLNVFVDNEVYKEYKFKYGEDVKIDEPAKNGYLFSGYDALIPTVMPNNDINVNATFDQTFYTITFLNYDGSVVSKQKLLKGTPIYANFSAVRPNTAQSSYSFVRWTGYYDGILATNNYIFNAVFKETPKKYNVTFKNYNGDILKTEDVVYGELPKFDLDDPVKIGTERFSYKFIGWDKMVEEVTKDVVYTALFEEIINYYNVTVKYNGELKQYKVKPGEVNTIPSITKEGYTFKGWSEDLTNLSCDIVVEPVFEINTYTLKYTLNGEHYIEKDYKYNDIIEEIDAPILDGMVFNKWENLVKKMPANDYTINGKYYIITDILSVTNLSKEYDGYTVDDPEVIINSDGRIGFEFYKDGKKLSGKPKDAGEYSLKVYVETSDLYYGLEEEFDFIIYKKNAEIVIDNQLSVYGEELNEFTYNVNGFIENVNIEVIKEEGIVPGFYELKTNYVNDNYVIKYINGIYEISKAKITAKLNDKESVYGEVLKELDYQIINGKLYYDDQINVEILKSGDNNSGKYDITAVCIDDKYDVEFINGIYTIHKAQSIIDSNDVVTVYNGNIHSILATLNHNESEIIFDNNAFVNAGIYEICVSVNETRNYLPTTKIVSLIIEKAEAIINISDYTADYNKEEHILKGELNHSESEILYSQNGFINAGIYEVLVSSLESQNYKAASKSIIVTINKINSIITYNDINVVYDGNIHSIQASLNHNESIIQYSNNNKIDAGYYEVIISVGESINYLGCSCKGYISIDKANTIIDTEDLTVTYDGVAHFINASINHGESNIVYDGNGKIDAGIYDVRITVDESKNYYGANKNVILIINKADSIIHVENKVFVYNGEVQNIEGVLNHNETSLKYSNNGFTDSGKYVVELTANETKNYKECIMTVEYEILKAKSIITVESDTYTYTGNRYDLIATLNHTEAEIIYSDNGYTNAGVYKITMTVEETRNYESLSVEHNLIINKAQSTITAYNQNVQYDKLPHSIDGVLNHNETVLEYSGRNFINVGIYQITITSNETENYYGASIIVTLNIYSGDYNYEGIEFNNFETVYDGKEMNIYIQGNLPDGMIVTYENNGHTDAGVYEIIANFTDTTGNYNTIAPLVATLTIKKADTIISVVNDRFIYNSETNYLEASINHSECVVEYINNVGFTNVGSYNVTIICNETKNYNAAKLDWVLIIEKAALEVNVIENQFVYDGTTKYLKVKTESDDLEIIYENNGHINAGKYYVNVSISESQNYYSYNGEFELIINKAETFIFGENINTVYDGTLQKIDIYSNHNECEVLVTGNQQVNAGKYEVTATMKETANYKAASRTFIIVIEKAETIISLNSALEFIYNGSSQGIKCNINHNEGTVVYENNNNIQGGIYNVTVSVSGAENYKDASCSYQYSIKYLVRFYNHNNILLYESKVLPDEIVDYIGDIPVKEPTLAYKYVFIGWDKDYSNVSSNLNIYPVFEAVPISYNVIFKDYDGNVYKEFSGVSKGDKVTIDTYPIVGSLDSLNTYKFLGWEEVDYDNSVTVNNMLYVYVNPIYELVPASCNIDGKYYAYISEALSVAKENDIVEVVKNNNADYGIYDSVIIPSGVTFYIPYKEGLTVDEVNGDVESGQFDSNLLYISVDLYGTMDIYGTLLIGAETGNIGGNVQGAINGRYSQIVMHDSSVINVGKFDGSKAGTVVSHGYIRDESNVNDKASINVYKDSLVKQPFVLTDWLGGSYAYDHFNTVSVFNRFQMPIIESETSYYNGSILKGMGKIYAGGQMNFTDFRVFGIEYNLGYYFGLLYLTSDDPNDKIVMDYSSNGEPISSTNYSDKCTIKVYGDCKDNYAQLKLEYNGVSAAPSTKKVHFPIHYGIDLSFERGKFICQYRYKIMPGGRVSISENASIEMYSLSGSTASICVYDSYEYPDSTCNYPTKDELISFGHSGIGVFELNGTLKHSTTLLAYLGGNFIGTGEMTVNKYVMTFDYKTVRVPVGDEIISTKEKINLYFNGTEITETGTYKG